VTKLFPYDRKSGSCSEMALSETGLRVLVADHVRRIALAAELVAGTAEGVVTCPEAFATVGCSVAFAAVAWAFFWGITR